MHAVGQVNWDDLGPYQQADILAYHQIVEHDAREVMNAKLGGSKKVTKRPKK